MRSCVVGIVFVIAGCGASTSGAATTVPVYPPNPTAPTWQQYCYMPELARQDRYMEDLNRDLAARGMEGWELVGFGPGFGGVFVCLKRPAP